MIDVLMKMVNLEMDINIERASWEHEDRDDCDASTNQGTPKTASKLPETRMQARNRSLLVLSEGGWPCWHLTLGLLASTIVRQEIPVVYPVCGTLYHKPHKFSKGKFYTWYFINICTMLSFKLRSYKYPAIEF